MLCRCVPLSVCDSESRMRSLHFTAQVDAWPASRGTKLIENVLANSLLRIVTMSDEEFFKLLVSNQAYEEVVNHSSKRVVTADAIIKRLLLWYAIRHSTSRK